MGIKAPDGWNLVVGFSEAPRGTYKEVREARPSQAEARRALMQFVENSRFENCDRVVLRLFLCDSLRDVDYKITHSLLPMSFDVATAMPRRPWLSTAQ